MNREFAKCCRLFIYSKLKPNLDVVPRYFSNQDKQRESDKLHNIKENKGEVHLFSRTDIEKIALAEKVRQPYKEGIYSGPELLPFMKIGTRIRRGKDWEWLSQDGFGNAEGEIIEDLNKNGWIRVKWDNGHINSYRMGVFNKYDLQLAVAGSVSPVEESNDEFYDDIVHDSTKKFDSNLFYYLLPMYYEKCFPYHQYYNWLSYGNDKYFSFREFCFVTSAGKYHRYRSLENEEEMKRSIITKRPYAIHIGGVYTNRPNLTKRLPIEAQEKELIFDIDMNDYNDVRNCCSNDEICHKCWKFIAIAVKILERALRDDFGFKHILWVFSGRRGVHCWVCDAKARSLTKYERKSIVNYLRVYGNRTTVTEDDLKHQHVEKSADIGLKHFESICVDQDLFCNRESLATFMNLIRDADCKVALSRILPKYKTSLEKWHAIREKLSNMDVDGIGGKNILKEVILHFIYPRLDTNVSIQVNHMLKSPFSIHPKTGFISIPIRTSNIDHFDPKKLANLSHLEDEIQKFDIINKGNTLQDIRKTSLKESLDYFEEFVSLLKEDCNENIPDNGT